MILRLVRVSVSFYLLIGVLLDARKRGCNMCKLQQGGSYIFAVSDEWLALRCLGSSGTELAGTAVSLSANRARRHTLCVLSAGAKLGLLTLCM